MAYTTLAKLNDIYTAQNAVIIESVLRNASILKNMMFKPASHGNVDKFRLHSSEPAVVETNNGAGLSATAIDGTLTSLNLAMLETLASEPVSIVDQTPLRGFPTPYESYFMERSPIYFAKLAKAFESKVLYGTTGVGGTTQFNGLIAKATADGTVIDLATPAAGETPASTGTDIVFWRMDETNSHGLFNETLVAAGNLVDFKWVPGKGMSQMVTQKDDSLVQAYSGVYKTALGLKIASAGYVSVIAGADATHKPTQANIDTAMLNAGSWNTNELGQMLIICSPKGYALLKEAVGGTLTRATNSGTNAISNNVEIYNNAVVVINTNINDAR